MTMGEAKRRSKMGGIAPVPKVPATGPARPDDAYPARGAYAFLPSDEIFEMIGAVPLFDATGYLGDQPVPFFLRLHAEGMTLDEFAASVVEVARSGLEKARKTPEPDADEWDAERLVDVSRHLQAFQDVKCTLRREVADFIVQAGYDWYSFDDDEDSDTPGVLAVQAIRAIALKGGNLGHVAYAMAEDIDVEPYGMEGLFKGFGAFEYEGRDVYAFSPEPSCRFKDSFDVAIGSAHGPKVRFTRIGETEPGILRMQAEPLGTQP